MLNFCGLSHLARRLAFPWFREGVLDIYINESVPSFVVFLYFIVLFHGDANIAGG